MSVRVPKLHLVGPLGTVSDAGSYADAAAAAVAGGVEAVHVRLPGRLGGDVLSLTRLVLEQNDGATVIVNDRLDVALITGAAGVHLGEHSIPVDDARLVLGTGALIGRSVHDLPGAERAEEAGADYLFAGHVFETESKSGQPGRGLDWLAEICSAVTIPVIAIGGITRARLAAVKQSGAWGVAVGREILDAKDRRLAASLLVEELQ